MSKIIKKQGIKFYYNVQQSNTNKKVIDQFVLFKSTRFGKANNKIIFFFLLLIREFLTILKLALASDVRLLPIKLLPLMTFNFTLSIINLSSLFSSLKLPKRIGKGRKEINNYF